MWKVIIFGYKGISQNFNPFNPYAAHFYDLMF